MKEKCHDCHENDEFKDSGLCKDCNDMKTIKTCFYVGAFGFSALVMYGVFVILLMSKST